METLFVLKKNKRRSLHTFIVMLILSFTSTTANLQAQNERDYRSIQSGEWTTVANWEYFDGTNWIAATYYPGENLEDSCGQVTIETGHVISLSSNLVETGKICFLLINGELLINGANNNAILVGINVHEIRVYGTINFQNKVIFNLMDNTVVKFFGAGSLIGDCSNNQEIQIGGIKIAACSGAPGTIYTFAELMAAGGTLDGNIDSPTSNSTYYCGYNIPLQGHFAGVYGTTTASGTTSGVNYSWSINNVAITGAAGTLTTPGALSPVYNFKPETRLPVGENTIRFTVTTYNDTQLYTNSIETKIIVPDSAKWTGTTNNEWSTAGNWFNDCMPDAELNVEISGGLISYPTIGVAAEVKNITLKSGATLLDGGNLTLASGGVAKVEQDLRTARTWYMASPVSGAPLNTGYTYYEYPETNANQLVSGTTPFAWTPGNYWSTPTEITFTPLKGYLIIPASAGTFTFEGNGFITKTPPIATLTRTELNPKRGFNLVGNPYPSYVNWDAATTSNLDATMWYRTTNSGGTFVFDTYSSATKLATQNGASLVTNWIPPMQSFWVRVVAGQTSGTLSFSQTARGHRDAPANVLKAKAAQTRQMLRFRVSNGTNSDETLLLFLENALDVLDSFDSEKMSNGNKSIPEIFTTVGGKETVINGMAKFTGQKSIYLGFRSLLEAQAPFTIELAEMTGFPEGTVVKLKNNITGIEAILSLGEIMNFMSVKITNRQLFSIALSVPEDTEPEIKSEDPPVHEQNIVVSAQKNGHIVVRCFETIFRGAIVTVYNADGVKLVSSALKGETTVVNTKFTPGIYTVVVNNNNITTTRKVVVGN